MAQMVLKENMRTQILDHGYLEEIEHWGSDERIVEAARMSTGKGFLGWDPGPCPVCGGKGILEDTDDTSPPVCYGCEGKGTVVGDRKLLAYLYSNHHDTPFEMAGVIIEVQAPIFVFREWHRHRTQSYNEMSARYVPLPDVNYIPTVERLMINSKNNKQAGVIKGATELTEEKALSYQQDLKQHYFDCEFFYQAALNNGIPKELARIHLPVGRYSKMRASANLRNWLAFMTLRMAPGAQWEIRMYANEVAKVIERDFPETYALFNTGRK